MDGDDVSTSDLQRLGNLVMTLALQVKEPDGSLRYDVRPGRRTGGRTLLAKDAGMDHGQLSRLLSGERMPDARLLVGLAKALGTTVEALLADSDNYPERSAHQGPQESVRSRPLTPDEVADSWQVDVADVRAMYEILRRKPKPATEDDHDGKEEAHG